MTVVTTEREILIAEAAEGHANAEAAETRATGATREASAWRWYTAERVWLLRQTGMTQDAIGAVVSPGVDAQSQMSVYERAWAKFSSVPLEDRPSVWTDVKHAVQEKLGKREEARLIVEGLREMGGTFVPQFGGGMVELAAAVGIPVPSNPRWRSTAGWDGTNHLRSEDGHLEFGATLKFQETKTGWEPFVLLEGLASEAEVTVAGICERLRNMVTPLHNVTSQLSRVSGQPSEECMQEFQAVCTLVEDALAQVTEYRSRF